MKNGQIGNFFDKDFTLYRFMARFLLSLPMMKRISMLLMALLASAMLSAQELKIPAQETAMPVIDAQSLGMGGVTMASVQDAHALFNNAAMTAFTLHPMRISASYYGQTEFDYYGLSGYWRFDRNNTLQIGWRQYLREKGNRDSALDLGYTRRLGEEFSVAAVARYMHLKRYAEEQDALALDLAAGWQHPIEGWKHYSTVRLGAKLSNLGAMLGDSELSLPMEMKVGAALETFFSDQHQLTVGCDLGYYFTPAAVRGFQAALGAEYNLMQLIQLRAGYHVGERDAYYPSFGSVGAGIRILHLRVDFAYLIAKKSSLLYNTYSISFGLDF